MSTDMPRCPCTTVSKTRYCRCRTIPIYIDQAACRVLAKYWLIPITLLWVKCEPIRSRFLPSCIPARNSPKQILHVRIHQQAIQNEWLFSMAASSNRLNNSFPQLRKHEQNNKIERE